MAAAVKLPASASWRTVTLVARAERSGAQVAVSPAKGFGIFVSLGGVEELDRNVRRGRSFLRGLLAVALSLLAVGIYAMMR